MANYQSELAELMPETSTADVQGVGVNVRRLIKLRGRFMVLLFLAIIVPSAAAIWMLVPRHYVASADIEFQASAPSILKLTTSSMSGTAAYESFVNTQISLITGYTILSRVLKNEEVANLPIIRKHGDGALIYLMAHIEAQVQNQTELVTFSFKDPDRETARFILNAVFETYRTYVQEEEKRQGERRREILKEREERLMEALDQQRLLIADVRKEHGIPVTTEVGLDPAELESNRLSLSQAQADLSAAESLVRQTESLIEHVKQLRDENAANPSAPVFARGVEDKVLADPNVMQLIEQLAQKQQEFSVLDKTYVSTAPQVTVKREELEGLEQKLDLVKAEARSTALNSLIGDYEYDLTTHQSSLESARARVEKFTGLIEGQRQDNLERAGIYAEIETMEKRAEDIRADLRQIRDTINTIDIESNAPARANLLGEASVSNNADYSERIKFMLVAILFAFTMTAVAGLLKEQMDQNIRSAEDVGYVTTLPILASILHTDEDRLPSGVKVSTITEQHSDSMTADEFRRAAGRILGAARGRRKVRTCMIASPARGDGKTTLACNLAIVLAQAGRKVLLLDVDSRNPSVEASFGLQLGPGLAEILAGQSVPRDPSRKTPYPNLHIMGPGLRSNGLLERLASREMEDFMAGASEVFDHIVIDTPASLLMSEPKMIAPLVDGIVLVTGAGVSSFGMLRRALRVMRESDGEMLGVVVNAVRHAPGGYMRQNVDMYYAQDRAQQRAPRTTAAT